MQTLERNTGSHRFLLKKDTHEIGLILGRFRENTGCRTSMLIDEAGHGGNFVGLVKGGCHAQRPALLGSRARNAIQEIGEERFMRVARPGIQHQPQRERRVACHRARRVQEVGVDVAHRAPELVRQHHGRVRYHRAGHRNSLLLTETAQKIEEVRRLIRLIDVPVNCCRASKTTRQRNARLSKAHRMTSPSLPGTDWPVR